MSDYRYDPAAWHPALAGAVAGAIAGIVAALASLIPRSPDELIANSLSVTLVAIALGVISGMLWRRIRASRNAVRTFGWAMAGGWFIAMLATSLGHLFILDNLIQYAAPLAAIIFLTLGFLIPVLARVTAPWWIGLLAVGAALALGVFLFGKGNVASGDLSLDDLPTSTTSAPAAPGTTEAGASGSTTTSEPSAQLSGTVSIPEDLADRYEVTSGIATYTVDETLQGLSTVAVGETNAVTGALTPGGEFSFALDLQSFTSDQGRRDGRVRGWFEDFPEGTFSADSFELPATAEVGVPVQFDVVGTLTINGISKEVTWAVEARVEPNGTLSILGETDIVLSDFDIPVLEASFVTMVDGAHLEVLVSAAPAR